VIRAKQLVTKGQSKYFEAQALRRLRSCMLLLTWELGDSGRRIVNILEDNPTGNSSGYSDQDIDHMRRVVSYCKRHLAQEERAKQDTNSKSYRSLKNWGHDALKE
jgi:hypothetical protein